MKTPVSDFSRVVTKLSKAFATNGLPRLNFQMPVDVLAILVGTFDGTEDYVSVEFALCRPECQLGGPDERIIGECLFNSYNGQIKLRHLASSQCGVLLEGGKITYDAGGLKGLREKQAVQIQIPMRSVNAREGVIIVWEGEKIPKFVTEAISVEQPDGVKMVFGFCQTLGMVFSAW